MESTPAAGSPPLAEGQTVKVTPTHIGDSRWQRIRQQPLVENQTVKVLPAVKAPAAGGEDRDDEAGERKDIASRWQQYSETAQEHMFPSATLTSVDNPKRKYTLGNLWFNKGSPSRIS